MAKKTQPRWSLWSDEALLDLRLCELGVELDDTWVAGVFQTLCDQLHARGLRLSLNSWFSTEWFCPDGQTGIAAPFYLAHPRLMRLEYQAMGMLEGGNRTDCIKYYRHEAGHAIQHAFRLDRRPHWQRVFGSARAPYPDQYVPRPASRKHVVHLDYWYAQSHPVEDFAETFAVWLGPRRRWRSQYAGWPALKKLQYVDALMSDLVGQQSLVRSRARMDALVTQRQTLREYFAAKRSQYGGRESSSIYDLDLLRIFRPDEEGRGHESASAFMRHNRKEIFQDVLRIKEEYDVALTHVWREMFERVTLLSLRRINDEPDARKELTLLLLARTVEFIHTSRESYAL